MDDQNLILQKKSKEIQCQLELWAEEINFLKPGQQIEFTLAVKKVRAVVARTSSDILNARIPDIFTQQRCFELGISDNLRRRIIKTLFGKVNFGTFSAPITYEINTIRDLTKFSIQDISYLKNMGQLTVDAIKKVLESIDVELLQR